VIEIAQTSLSLAGDHLLYGFAVFLRLSTFLSLMPSFGEHSIPMRIKLMLALVMSAGVAPALTFPAQMPHPLMLIFTEILAGGLLGLIVRLFILALQVAGSIAAQATSLAQLLGGATTEPLPALGHVLVVGGLALISIFDLHVKAVLFFATSYSLLPLGLFPDGPLVGSWGSGQVSKMFSLAFSIAAPFIILSVIYNLMLGAINRAMPQLMVAFVGAPLITAGALGLFALAAPLMLATWIEAFSSFLENPG
jgi:flagellar biosynthetic protein FliR